MGIGIALMLLGAVLFAVAIYKKTSVNTKRVGHDDRSVNVGGSNHGFINTGSIGNQAPPPEAAPHGHSSSLVIISIVVELTGILVTLWHAYHLAPI